MTADPNFDIVAENPCTNDMLSGSPHTWSHAAFDARVQTWPKVDNQVALKNQNGIK